jgi:hypothetical protein
MGGYRQAIESVSEKIQTVYAHNDDRLLARGEPHSGMGAPLAPGRLNPLQSENGASGGARHSGAKMMAR